MDFRILGPLEVYEDGRPLPLGGRRQRELLALLLVHANEVVPAESLIEALWGDERPATAVKALQVHVSQLRRRLEPLRRPRSESRLLQSRGSGYALQLEPDQLDLYRFERLRAEARQALAEGVAAEAAAKLHEALTLWRGPPLADLASEPFAALEATRLEELHVAALEERIEADLALGREAELVAELESLAGRHPLRERLRGQLMLALYRSGRQAEALDIYQQTRRALVEELGIEPGPELQRLEQAILRQDPGLEATPARPLEQRAEPTEREHVEAQPVRKERKVATALFADLVGSTELGEQDPERTRALLDRFYDAMAEEIEQAGGTLEKFIGDAVMAAFGAPSAQEDHAERALHAALSMQQRLKEIFAGRLELRIGVNTGEVVVDRARGGGSFVTGDAVNIAARLEQTAAPGEILVGERTATAVGGAFELSDPLKVPAKGKVAGVACRRLLRSVSLARPRGVRGVREPFVGRGNDLDLLEATYERAVQEREPHVVTVLGEAGVGKTRLVRELCGRLESASPQPVVRSGRCLPYGRGVTYWPLAEVLRDQLGIAESDPPEVVRRKLGEREILGLTLGLEAAGDLHPLIARERLHEAWVELLDELVAERPSIVLVDDLHWADDALLDLLERLARDVLGPLLLITTARPELQDRRPTWGAGRNAALLWLEALSPKDARRMLDEMLGAGLPSQLSELVLENGEGNPFFVEELIATLIDHGVLERANGAWVARDLPAGFSIPDSIQAVLASRIDLLELPEKEALQAAAVIGRRFSAAHLRTLLQGSDPDLRLLQERDFVRRRPGSRPGEYEFAFKHALTREVAYASLPKARRAHLHATFADWLEAAGEGRDEHAPLLGHHYAEAVRPEDIDLAWPGEENEVERLRAKAVVWLRRAAALASGRYAVDDQLALLHRAVKLEPDAVAQLELWRTIARANALTYDKLAFRAALTRALELCTDPEPTAELYAELAFQTAFRWNHTEDREQVTHWIERGLGLAGPRTAARAWALIARSYCDLLAAEGAAREAARIAEDLPDADLRSYAFHARADSALARGSYAEACSWAERRLELIDEISDPDHRADIYWSAMPGYLGQGRIEEARRLARLHDEVTSTLTPHLQLHGVAFLLEVEELAGAWETIRSLTARAAEAAAASTPCVQRPRSLLVCALANAYLGDDAEARRLEQVADSLGESHGGSLDAPRVRLALHRGEHGAVERLLVESERRPPKLIRSTKFAPVAARLDALAALGNRDRVEQEAPALLRPNTYLEPFALRALALVRSEQRLIEQAAARFEELGLQWYASQTRALV
jgi:DNA-binding SARP family transcriptional activator